MNLLQDQSATCPHCWETISLTLDLSVPEQSYIEDCPVCCKPMMVSYSATDGEVVDFSLESAECRHPVMVRRAAPRRRVPEHRTVAAVRPAIPHRGA